MIEETKVMIRDVVPAPDIHTRENVLIGGQNMAPINREQEEPEELVGNNHFGQEPPGLNRIMIDRYV